jgi:hypothetical protein
MEEKVLLLRLGVDLGQDEDQVLVEVAHRNVAQGVGSSGLDLFAGRPASEAVAGSSTLPGGLFSYWARILVLNSSCGILGNSDTLLGERSVGRCEHIASGQWLLVVRNQHNTRMQSLV